MLESRHPLTRAREANEEVIEVPVQVALDAFNGSIR
jgi:hypothetical protein